MKSKIFTLLFSFLLATSSYAQIFKEDNCVDMKRQADSAYRIFEGKYAESFLTESNESWVYPYFHSYFKKYRNLAGTHCLTPEEREEAIQRLNADVGQFLSHGTYLCDMHEYERAAETFMEYADFCESGIALEANKQKDEVRRIKYFAIVCSAQTYNYLQTIKLMEDFINSDTTAAYIYDNSTNMWDMYYLLAEEYKKVGNDAKYLQTINLAMSRFPDQEVASLSLLINYYTSTQSNRQALVLVDRLLQTATRHSDSYYEYLNVKANLNVHIKEYEKAEEVYLTGLKDRPEDERFIQGLGVAYALHAQELKYDNEHKQGKEKQVVDKQVKQYYSKAVVELEKYRAKLIARNASEDEQKSALSYLRTIYYELEDTQNFDKIDKLLNP